MTLTRPRTLFLLLLIIFTGGCANMQPQKTMSQTKIGGLDVMAHSPEQHLLLFQKPDNDIRFCMTPTPDAVGTYSDGVSFSTGLAVGTSDKIGDDSQQGALSLGGRAPSVLITRELMYRACELSMNIKADHDLTLKIYKQTIEAIKVIIATQHSAGSSALAAVPGDSRLDDFDMKTFCKRYPSNDLCGGGDSN